MAAVLLVDDQENQRTILANILAAEGHTVFHASSVAEARQQIEAKHPEVVVTDLKMPGESGMGLVEGSGRTANFPEIIMATAFGTIETAIKAIQLGAYDYLTKPITPEKLLFLIEKARQKYILKLDRNHFQKELEEEIGSNLVAESAGMRQIFDTIGRVAPTDSTVFITGETGTGKECIARLIHLKSPYGNKRMHSINCAAFPETLLDSELFGHEKGSFTGAVARKIGVVEAASGSTLFLDEVADMSLNTQAKLLRVLQEKEIRRVGGTETIPVAIRIIAATNKNLEDAIAKGAFRKDLFYRLNIVPIFIPPLRERKDDIPGLINHFFEKFGRKETVEEEAMLHLLEYEWPGNVRELEAVIERIAVLSHGAGVTLQDLPNELKKRPQHVQSGSPWDIPDSGINYKEWEQKLYSIAYDKAGGNMTEAARLLGLTYRAFRYRAEQSGLKEK